MPPTKRATKVPDKSAPSYEGYEYPSENEINEPPTKFDGYIRCIFGRKGIGKSTLASQTPKSLTLMFEPRRRNLRIRQLNLQKRTATEIMAGEDNVWEKIKLSTQSWIDDSTISCLNFDSIDICYECCYHSVLASYSYDTMEEAGKNSSNIWNEIRDEWSSYFDLLASTRLSINFLSHMKLRETEELDGGKYEKRSPSCSPACLLYIKQACDFIFYYGTHQSKRAIQLRDPTGMAEVASGAEGRFLDPKGRPINIIEMPELESGNGYDTLVAGFNNELWDIETPEDERGTSRPIPRKKRRS